MTESLGRGDRRDRSHDSAGARAHSGSSAGEAGGFDRAGQAGDESDSRRWWDVLSGESPPRDDSRTRSVGDPSGPERERAGEVARGDDRADAARGGNPAFGARDASSPDPARVSGAPRPPRLSELGPAGPPSSNSDDPLGLVRIEAPTYAEALREIRRRFGDDVSIVHTRVIRRKGMLGVLGATGVEVYVTGRGEYEEWRRQPGRDAGAGPFPSPADARETPSNTGGAPGPGDAWSPSWLGREGSAETPAAPSRPAASPGFDASRVLAGREEADGTPVGAGSPEEGSPEDVVRALERLSKKIGNVTGGAVGRPLHPGARPEDARSAAHPEVAHPAGRPRVDGPRVEGTYARPAPVRNPVGPAEVRAAEAVTDSSAGSSGAGGVSGAGGLSGAGDRAAPPRSPGLTHPVIVAAKKIIGAWGVSDEIAAELLGKLSRRNLPSLSGNREECDQLAKLHLREVVRPKLPPTRPIPRPQAGRRRIVSLVGPTGVGKTTTLAKLGALFRFTERVKVGFITLDTYRIGAVDQLRRYADIIQVPLEVVSPGGDLVEAVGRLGDVDVILIDTAGRSQKDADRIHELRSMLAGVGELEVHLCLALSAAPEAILAAAENFKVVDYSRILITKLDESYRHGVLLDLFQRAKAPVSYVTVGQEVPDDIHTATMERLEDLLLGDD